MLTNARQGAYLAGVLAATMTKTGTLGMVISADTPSWHKANGGFVKGAQSVNPDIKFLLAQTGQDAYGDAARGKRIDRDRSSRAARTSCSARATAPRSGCSRRSRPPPRPRARTRSGSSMSSATSRPDRRPKDVVLSSVLWNFAGTFKQAIADIDAGTFGNAGYVQDLANGGISLLETDNITPEAWAAVEAAKAGHRRRPDPRPGDDDQGRRSRHCTRRN